MVHGRPADPERHTPSGVQELFPELHEAHIKLTKLNTQENEAELGMKTELTQNNNSNQNISILGKDETTNLDIQENSNNLSPVFPDLDNLDLEELSNSEWHNYYNQGNQLQLEGKLEKATITYYQSILRNPHHSWSYHNLGDTHLKLGHWQEAITAYRKAIRLNPDYFWSNYNLGVAYSNSEQWELAIQLYRRSIKLNPGLNLPFFALKETLEKQWNATTEKADILLKQGDRKSANNIYKQLIKQYDNSLLLKNLNIPKEIPTQPKVLLVVDDFLPQCLRYRVHQKIEQLEYAGFPVEFIPHREIQEAKNIIHFFHVVIFYRVPAFPDIIETIKYAKAIKKVVFYEIDDLIFDPEEYPDSFESYAGQITVEEYGGLCKGTILFQEAMALSDYGIASTPALVQAMEKVIPTKTVFLHRNALDSHNYDFLKVGIPNIKRDYISIFYGTGTKAHNSDFNELAAPAIARILENYPQVRLTVVGYLTLPEDLVAYKDRIDQIKVIADIKAYWDFLRQADINIAVLHPTKVNNCKSELKWFEAALLGVPSVVSATQTYLEVVEHGVDGLIANSIEEWYENLECLVTDEQLRTSIAQAAYEKTVQNYSIPVMAKNIHQIIMTGIESDIKKGNLVPPSSKKKLLIVNVFYPPQSIGGGTRIVRDNVDILMEKYSDQYDIQVFTSDDDNPVPYQIKEYIYKNVHVTKVSTPMQEGMDWRYKNPEMYDIFTQYLKFNQPDLIHFHCVQRLTGSVLEAAANLNIPYLVTIHDAWWISDHQFLVNQEGLECDYQQNDPLVVTRDVKDITQSICRRHYLRQRLNEASVVLAVSETFAELYRRNGFPQTRSNRNGIMPRPKLPRQPSNTGRVRLAHIGGMAAHKGYFLLKQAVESTSLSNLELIVVNHAQAAGTISEDYWGTTPVKFINKIPQEKMPEFYSTIDILTAPSIWPESYGLVAREALAAGVWVIVSNKGALAEDLIPGVHGDVFNPDYPEELVEILKTIDMNPEFYQQMLKDDFPVRTTEDQVRELQEIYGSVGNFDNLSTSNIKISYFLYLTWLNQITRILKTDQFEIMQQTVEPSKTDQFEIMQQTVEPSEIVQNNNPLKVLLCGFEHSGTTLVSELLRQHPQLDSGFEGGFLLNDSIHQFLSTEPFYTNVKGGWGVNDDDLKYICDAEDWPDVYQRLRERARIIKNKDVLLFDKTPQYMQTLPSVLERVPDVSCIVIVRDFRAIFWSSFKRTGLTIDEWYEKIFPITVNHVLSYCKGWQQALEKGFANRILLVKYEDLCLNQYQELSKIFDFLGLEFVKSYLSFSEVRYPHVYGNNISNKYLLEYQDNLPNHICIQIKESMSKYSDWFWGDS